MKEKTYHEKIKIENELKLREQLQLLPKFCRDFFIGIEPTTSSRTRIAYAYDLGVFFEYIHETNPIYKKMDITEFPLEILDQLKAGDIEEYLNPASKQEHIKSLYRRRTAKVSLTNNLDTAIYYAQKASTEKGGEPVVYELDPNLFMLMRVGKNTFITDKAKIVGKVDINEYLKSKV